MNVNRSLILWRANGSESEYIIQQQVLTSLILCFSHQVCGLILQCSVCCRKYK